MTAAYDALKRALAARPAGERELRRPATWGGYRLWPQAIEFWQGRPHRFHDRFLRDPIQLRGHLGLL